MIDKREAPKEPSSSYNGRTAYYYLCYRDLAILEADRLVDLLIRPKKEGA